MTAVDPEEGDLPEGRSQVNNSQSTNNLQERRFRKIKGYTKERKEQTTTPDIHT